MSFGACKQSICLDDILSKVSEVDILNHYLGISTLPALINSPFRQDNNPSVSIFENSNNNIIFKDFGTNSSYNLWSFLEKYWNCSFDKVLLKISQEIQNIHSISHNKRTTTYKKYVHNSTKVEVTIRDWKEHDLQYWESFGISLQWLKFGRVYPISHIFINGNRFAAEKHAYVYIENKDNTPTLKIYQPYSTRMKWLSKHDNSVWDLWDKLPEQGDKLIITSSRKDALCIWENTNIPSISLQGEGYIPKEHVIQQLKERFKNIYVLYDNDFKSDVNNGRNFGKILADKFNLTQVEIPVEYQSKDTSDLCLNWGRNTVKSVINLLINNSQVRE